MGIQVGKAWREFRQIRDQGLIHKSERVIKWGRGWEGVGLAMYDWVEEGGERGGGIRTNREKNMGVELRERGMCKCRTREEKRSVGKAATTQCNGC